MQIVTDDVRGSACPNCGYQETGAHVDKRVRIEEEVLAPLSSSTTPTTNEDKKKKNTVRFQKDGLTVFWS